MGDMADYYREQELNAQFNSNRFEDEYPDEPIDTSMWEAKTGGNIPVVKMGDSHLINSHKMITRDNWREECLILYI